MVATRKIEINGQTFEVKDSAKKIDSYKVGDPIKVLIKGYGNDYTVYHGIIIGFNDFKQKPAINIAYINLDYSNAEIKFKTYTDGSDIEIAPVTELELIRFKTDDAIDKMRRTIEQKENELKDLKDKFQFFIENCGAFTKI
jgi:hypothetical protein